MTNNYEDYDDKAYEAIVQLKTRLRLAKVPFKANDNIADHLLPEDMSLIEHQVLRSCMDLLNSLIIDTRNDHNTRDTAKRMTKMFLTEVMHGRYEKAPEITQFENAKSLGEMYTVGPIRIRSMCSHHMVPILGKAWIGIIPNKDKVLGLSKYSRIAKWVFSRPQIQEEAVMQFADKLEELLQPVGLAIVLRADHMCMHWRGIQDSSSMTNAVVRGTFVDNPTLKNEFYQLISGQEF